MKKSDVPCAAERFSGMPPLESVKTSTLCSCLTVKKRQKGKRTLATYDKSRAHFHEVPVRRLFVELPDADWNTLATVNASARWQARKGLNNPSLFLHVKRDIRRFVDGC